MQDVFVVILCEYKNDEHNCTINGKTQTPLFYYLVQINKNKRRRIIT